MPDFALERELGHDRGRIVIGLDEAGRGPWAGPVVAAAAWLDPAGLDPALSEGLDDSKKLSAKRRNDLFDILSDPACAGARVAVGEASVEEIDDLNILQASLLAMRRAVAGLKVTPELVFIDGNRCPALPMEARAVVKGDSLVAAISAASILAKVTRDRAMAALARDYPGYGWERNQGYGTAEHRAGIARLGVTPLHRRSFRPIRDALTSKS